MLSKTDSYASRAPFLSLLSRLPSDGELGMEGEMDAAAAQLDVFGVPIKPVCLRADRR